jgi:nucleotide-binding universal stress UspA family protein
MKTILVPLDGSKIAERVLPYVRQLAPLLSARVRLLQVIPDLQPFDVLVEGAARVEQHGGSPITLDVLQNAAERYLTDQANTLRMVGINVDVETRIGNAADEIIEAAERDQATLVAIATHGYTGLKRWAMGSITDKVVQAAHIPVLVVRGTEEQPAPNWPIRRVMVPLDGSKLARQALPLAVEVAIHSHATLLPISVATPPILGDIAAVADYNELLKPLRERMWGELSEVADQLSMHDVTVKPIVASGMVASTIVDRAEQQGADLIVMATHGASGLRRWALGSVTDKVLHIATTPVLVVRAR